MAGNQLTDVQWISAWKECGSVTIMAEKYKISHRQIYARRRALENKLGIELPTFNSQNPAYLKKIDQTPHNVRRSWLAGRSGD